MKQVVLITGASSGIGKSTAAYFAARGWQVVATMRDTGNAGELKGMDGVICLTLDVTKDSSIKKAVEMVLKQYGHIDALINNAGYGLLGSFEAATLEQIQAQLQVNILGVMQMIQAVLPHMRERRSGVIVNLSSVAGRIGFPYYSVYNATKWAVEGLSESLSHELSSFGIRVKVVQPGPIQTDFFTRSAVYTQKKELQLYEAYEKKVFGGMRSQNGTFASPPVDVAKVIYHAVEDRSLKLRFPAGSIAPFLLIMRKILPDRLFFYLLRKQLL
jgi:NAD(P)-dependent dehydrogenase (short-subunit alcohol dehydrogenase family)